MFTPRFKHYKAWQQYVDKITSIYIDLMEKDEAYENSQETQDYDVESSIHVQDDGEEEESPSSILSYSAHHRRRGATRRRKSLADSRATMPTTPAKESSTVSSRAVCPGAPRKKGRGNAGTVIERGNPPEDDSYEPEGINPCNSDEWYSDSSE